MSLQRVISCGAWILLAAVASQAHAVATSWDAGGPTDTGFDGFFNEPLDWNTNQVPGAGDTATFGVNATYQVSLQGDVASDALTVSAGNVLIMPLSSGAIDTYDVTTGAADLAVNGGILRLGIGINNT